METTSSGIRILEGTTDMLIVAPHGPVIDGEYENDARTGVIVEQIQQRLGCCAIVNDRFLKPTLEIPKNSRNFRLDLFRIDHGGKVPGYLESMRQVVDMAEKTLVLWVHGISDKFALMRGQEHVELGLFMKTPEELHALVGYGQGADPKSGDLSDRFTAFQSTVERFCESLSSGGMNTILSHPEASNYRGRDSKRLNQWFVQSGHGLDRVQSIQLEIREKGFRDTTENASKCAAIIADALAAMRDGRR